MNCREFFKRRLPGETVPDDTTKPSIEEPTHAAGSENPPPAKRKKVVSCNIPWPSEWGDLSKGDLEKRFVPELKAMCEQLGLAKSGRKEGFVNRLLEFQAKAKAAAPPPVSLPEAGDGAVQGEADAPAPQVAPHQEPDLRSAMTGHQGLAQGSLLSLDLMTEHLLGPI